MNYIVNPEDYKTKEEYTKAIDTIIFRKEEKMQDCRMRLIYLNQSKLGALYLEHLEYEACQKHLTDYGKEKYRKDKEDYESAYNCLQKEYDETLHAWTKMKKEKQIVLINFNGE